MKTINIVNMSTLPKLIYMSGSEWNWNVIPIKILEVSCADIDKLQLIWEFKEPNNFEKKVQRLILFDFKTYHKDRMTLY